MMTKPNITTGIHGFDELIQGIRLGDNVVLQVDSIDDYQPFVDRFCEEANQQGHVLVYFRFAGHRALLRPEVKAEVYELNPNEGFEPFISTIFDIIERYGVGACYVFDCLSGLSADWYSDRMLANFFMLTCPYLYDYDTVAYFALLCDHHMVLATSAIHNTAQVIVDIYRKNDQIFVLPIKVYKRYSPTIYMLHAWEGETFRTVTHSAVISEILGSVPQPWLDFSIQPLDVWTKTFTHARQCLANTPDDSHDNPEHRALVDRLIRMVITRDERLTALAQRYLCLKDLVDVGKRMVGTGLIGGKSVGMLLARAIVRSQSTQLAARLEMHDSFFIGCDVFYSYLIRNGCWWARRQIKQQESFLEEADEMRARMLNGTFSDEIQEQFKEILEYYGQSPVIVRSSSLLEDAYGNAFSGKYESVFCANQGTPTERLNEFMDAVRTVYASTMHKEALIYRQQRGLLHQDEQMALLVQRVSGAKYGDYYFPQVAGVGYSFNPYPWNPDIDPDSGMLRLVFGLGTRAVDRADDDYTRIVALNAPHLRPEANFDEVKRFAQRRVDVLDLKEDCHKSYYFADIVRTIRDFPVEIFASRDTELEQRARELKAQNIFSFVLTFDYLLTRTSVVADMQEILRILEQAYQHPVDIEFTANFLDEQDYRINLVQCRPFQVQGRQSALVAPTGITDDQIVFRTEGPIIGNSAALVIDQLIYVVPEAYSNLSSNDKYQLAQLLGRLTHLGGSPAPIIALLGPGRWGTSTPALGVPVTFSQVNTVAVICELAKMHEGLIPDVSLGTHFFNDLVEMNMLYMAIYPNRSGSLFNEQFLDQAPNSLLELLPDAGKWESVVRVITTQGVGGKHAAKVFADSVKQTGMCYLGEITP